MHLVTITPPSSINTRNLLPSLRIAETTDLRAFYRPTIAERPCWSRRRTRCMQTSRYFSSPCFMALVTPKPSPVKLLRLVHSFIHWYIGLLVGWLDHWLVLWLIPFFLEIYCNLSFVWIFWVAFLFVWVTPIRALDGSGTELLLGITAVKKSICFCKLFLSDSMKTEFSNARRVWEMGTCHA